MAFCTREHLTREASTQVKLKRVVFSGLCKSSVSLAMLTTVCFFIEFQNTKIGEVEDAAPEPHVTPSIRTLNLHELSKVRVSRDVHVDVFGAVVASGH